MASEKHKSEQIAIVAITKEAVKLALHLAKTLNGSTLYISSRSKDVRREHPTEVKTFENLASIFHEIWNQHNVILCIMATGIVVRTVAPFIKKKTVDPAVLVMDEQGKFVISLLSGHYGGANAWAQKIANLVGATPVITTSSDVKGKIALDLLARDRNLVVVEPHEAPSINLASTMRKLLDDEPLWIFDPEDYIKSQLIKDYPSLIPVSLLSGEEFENIVQLPGIWVSEKIPPKGLQCLRLHPQNLIVGVGCNRNTSGSEIFSLIEDTFNREGLFIGSIYAIVSAEIKRNEEGLKEISERLNVPLFFVSMKSLDAVSVLNPSEVVQKHIGVKGVCEAAPIALNPSAQLIVTKTKSINATVAVARVPYQS